MIAADYYFHLGILCCIYLLLSQGFNVCFGMGRLFNLSHVASYAVGAYTTAILATEHGAHFFTCVGASATIVAVFSLIVGLISLRLDNDYFAIGTLAFSFLVQALLINWKSLTRGVLGIPGIPRPPFSEWLASIGLHEESTGGSNLSFFVCSAAIATGGMICMALLQKSQFARQLRMQSENPIAAQSLGVSLFRVRNIAFVISAVMAGIAGSLFAYYLSYIDPSSFALHEMVFVLMVVVVGKPGSLTGVFLSTIFLVLLPEPLRYLDLDPGTLGPMRQLLYACILFLAVLLGRNTLFPNQRTI